MVVDLEVELAVDLGILTDVLIQGVKKAMIELNLHGLYFESFYGYALENWFLLDVLVLILEIYSKDHWNWLVVWAYYFLLGRVVQKFELKIR